ncbi:16S rRNA (guanine(527)-N(7))-methyltransferase RsmG [Nitratireductor thuwali]|uniref:Ribosomal RNA small subunit methyltransferase G n=1 Tax=Nitratireductor thuwali TaxID=2267699 RepID=A0ABY5MKA3_9HYPH|nr:Ribosomal RNA small subunit methyltransferase G [Nitratireductor thuwali]
MTTDRFESLRAAAGPVSRETFMGLESFESTFRRWAPHINLAAPSTLPALWERHILDSAQLWRLAPKALHWLDLGSGGGFPGAVIAVLARERPSAHVDLVESNRKKASFLQTTLAGLQCPAKVHARRIEMCHAALGVPDVVTARALAPLGTLLTLAEPWISGGARALFHKGRDYRLEVAESGAAWKYDLVEHCDLIAGEGVILEISNLQRR